MATPSKIGKYDVIDIIGRGGMGVVYQAKDPYLDRLVAIKMMNVDVHENTDFLERFYREAKSTASLRHPNIVTVYDLGEYQNRPFLVMEYLEGHSLESLLRAHRPMTVLEKISIIVEVCQGLGYAHQHGIIHRDIKPANIMVLNDGGVKIVDFGIARLGDNTLTRTGQIVGSLYYMPPEQLRDKPVDTRADIYSTGVVLYQLLTYSLPFEGESTGSTLAKIISDDPPPFSQFALTYPPELETITLKSLSKNRDQRFPTAEAFAAALTEVLDGFKQASIHEYLTKAELLQQSNELQQAQEYLLKVLKLDRQHTVAARQLSALRAKLQAQLSAERVRSLKQQAEEAYARDEFDAALGFLNQAIELDNNPDLQTLRTNIEKAKAEAEIVRKAISRAEAAQRSGDLDSAKSAIDSALSRRPNDSKIKVLRRAIDRDLEERERQRQVEGLLDEARKQMGGRKFTAALDLLREAQKLDPAAPQLRILLERLASEHQQEKHRRELERVNREVQEAIDRDDYKSASARAAEALAKFPNEAGLARLKELADTQIEIAAQKEFVRNQTAACQQLLDNGQTQTALDLVEKALEKVPGNARLESFRTMIQDRMLKERAEADKATCLRQANEAISLGRYADAIQILEGAQLRFVDTADVEELLRFARDQQAKARRHAAVEEAMRGAQRLLAEQDFEGAVALLEKAVEQTPSEDLDILLLQARDRRDGFRRELEAAMAKGRSLLEEGAIENAREFLSSRPASYQQSSEFRDLLEKADSTPIPVLYVDPSAADATLIFSPQAEPVSRTTTAERKSSPSIFQPATEQESGVGIFPPAEPEPFVEEPSELPEAKLPPWKRKPVVIGAVAAAILVVGLIIWWPKPPVTPTEGDLTIQVRSGGRPLPGAQLVIDSKTSGTTESNGTIESKVSPGTHGLRVTLEGYDPWSENVTINAGERKSVSAELNQKVVLQKLGTLHVRSSVPGAEVFVDGQSKGTTGHDSKLKIPLEVGSHKIQLKKSGYQDSAEQPIEIVEKRETVLPPIKLQEIVGETYLTIDSKPRAAAVRVDNRAAGTVEGRPLKVKVAEGTHTVQVIKEGYDLWENKVVVKKDQNLPIQANLTMLPVLSPSISAFTAVPDAVKKGERTQLRWEAQHATDISIDNGVGTFRSPSGSQEVQPSETTTYILTARGPGGSTTARVTVNVTAPPLLPRLAATGTFSASPTKLEEGQTAKLTWTTQNATEVSIEPGIGAVPTSGTQDVTPSNTTTYILTAKGLGGNYTPRVEILVQPKSETTKKSEEPSPDVDGIRQALNEFKNIYEGMVAEDLQNIWPSISKRQVEAIKAANKGAQSLRLNDNCPGSPKITGDTADWTCSESMTYVRNGKRQPPLTNPMTFKFRKSGGKWVVDGRHG
jgi:eukaryotic-like serine/threonine-protein kinase